MKTTDLTKVTPVDIPEEVTKMVERVCGTRFEALEKLLVSTVAGGNLELVETHSQDKRVITYRYEFREYTPQVTGDVEALLHELAVVYKRVCKMRKLGGNREVDDRNKAVRMRATYGEIKTILHNMLPKLRYTIAALERDRDKYMAEAIKYSNIVHEDIKDAISRSLLDKCPQCDKWRDLLQELLNCKPTTFSSVKTDRGTEIHLFNCPFCGHKSEYEKGVEKYICVNPGIGMKPCPANEAREALKERQNSEAGGDAGSRPSERSGQACPELSGETTAPPADLETDHERT